MAKKNLQVVFSNLVSTNRDTCVRTAHPGHIMSKALLHGGMSSINDLANCFQTSTKNKISGLLLQDSQPAEQAQKQTVPDKLIEGTMLLTDFLQDLEKFAWRDGTIDDYQTKLRSWQNLSVHEIIKKLMHLIDSHGKRILTDDEKYLFESTRTVMSGIIETLSPRFLAHFPQILKNSHAMLVFSIRHTIRSIKIHKAAIPSPYGEPTSLYQPEPGLRRSKDACAPAHSATDADCANSTFGSDPPTPDCSDAAVIPAIEAAPTQEAQEHAGKIGGLFVAFQPNEKPFACCVLNDGNTTYRLEIKGDSRTDMTFDIHHLDSALKDTCSLLPMYAPQDDDSCLGQREPFLVNLTTKRILPPGATNNARPVDAQEESEVLYMCSNVFLQHLWGRFHTLLERLLSPRFFSQKKKITVDTRWDTDIAERHHNLKYGSTKFFILTRKAFFPESFGDKPLVRALEIFKNEYNLALHDKQSEMDEEAPSLRLMPVDERHTASVMSPKTQTKSQGVKRKPSGASAESSRCLKALTWPLQQGEESRCVISEAYGRPCRMAKLKALSKLTDE